MTTHCKETKEDKNVYCVYIARVRGSILYIGSGVHGRWEHVNSGTSHNYGLNKLHFSGEELEIEVVFSGLSKKQSLKEEKFLILLHKPSLNVVWVTNNRGINASKISLFKKDFEGIIMKLCRKISFTRRKQYLDSFNELLRYYTIHDFLYGIPLGYTNNSGQPCERAASQSLSNSLGLVQTMKLYKNIVQTGSSVFELFVDGKLTYLKLKDSVISDMAVGKQAFCGLTKPSHFILR